LQGSLRVEASTAYIFEMNINIILKLLHDPGGTSQVILEVAEMPPFFLDGGVSYLLPRGGV
jgi:hypothetical protein